MHKKEKDILAIYVLQTFTVVRVEIFNMKNGLGHSKQYTLASKFLLLCITLSHAALQEDFSIVLFIPKSSKCMKCPSFPSSYFWSPWKVIWSAKRVHSFWLISKPYQVFIIKWSYFNLKRGHLKKRSS